jgi:hypothetical protein
VLDQKVGLVKEVGLQDVGGNVKKNIKMNLKQMQQVVKELKKASKMHAAQAAKIEKMIKKTSKNKK